MRKRHPVSVYYLLTQVHGYAHLDSRLKMRLRTAHINELMISGGELLSVLILGERILPLCIRAISDIA